MPYHSRLRPNDQDNHYSHRIEMIVEYKQDSDLRHCHQHIGIHWVCRSVDVEEVLQTQIDHVACAPSQEESIDVPQ